MALESQGIKFFWSTATGHSTAATCAVDEINSIGATVEIISDTQVRLKPTADLDYGTSYFLLHFPRI